jgi:excinuclease ABC subunit B
VLYADHLTEAIQTCVRITQRQRAKQIQFNELHGIEPRSIVKELRPFSDTWSYNDANNNKLTLMWAAEQAASYRSERDLLNEIEHLEAEMLNAANKLEFETAAKLRDQIHALRQIYLLQYAEKSDIS